MAREQQHGQALQVVPWPRFNPSLAKWLRVGHPASDDEVASCCPTQEVHHKLVQTRAESAVRISDLRAESDKLRALYGKK